MDDFSEKTDTTWRSIFSVLGFVYGLFLVGVLLVFLFG